MKHWWLGILAPERWNERFGAWVKAEVVVLVHSNGEHNSIIAAVAIHKLSDEERDDDSSWPLRRPRFRRLDTNFISSFILCFYYLIWKCRCCFCIPYLGRQFQSCTINTNNDNTRACWLVLQRITWMMKVLWSIFCSFWCVSFSVFSDADSLAWCVLILDESSVVSPWHSYLYSP